MVLVVGAAFLIGGTAVFAVLVDQEIPPGDPDWPCATGPWGASWIGESSAFEQAPANGTHSGLEVRLDPAPGNHTLPANGTPAGWGLASLAWARWHPPPSRSKGFGNGTITVAPEQDGQANIFYVRFERSGQDETLQDLVASAGSNVTNATYQEMRSHASWMGVGESSKEGRFSTTWGFDRGHTDLSRLLGIVGDASNWQKQGVVQDTTEEHVPFTVGYRAANWSVGLHPTVKRVSGEVEGTQVRLGLAATGEGVVELDGADRPTDEEVNRILDRIYAKLGIGDTPERSWSWDSSAVC